MFSSVPLLDRIMLWYDHTFRITDHLIVEHTNPLMQIFDGFFIVIPVNFLTKYRVGGLRPCNLILVNFRDFGISSVDLNIKNSYCVRGYITIIDKFHSRVSSLRTHAYLKLTAFTRELA